MLQFRVVFPDFCGIFVQYTVPIWGNKELLFRKFTENKNTTCLLGYGNLIWCKFEWLSPCGSLSPIFSCVLSTSEWTVSPYPKFLLLLLLFLCSEPITCEVALHFLYIYIPQYARSHVFMHTWRCCPWMSEKKEVHFSLHF